MESSAHVTSTFNARAREKVGVRKCTSSNLGEQIQDALNYQNQSKYSTAEAPLGTCPLRDIKCGLCHKKNNILLTSKKAKASLKLV